MSKYTQKRRKLSIVPIIDESIEEFATDVLPTISWSTSDEGRGRRRATRRMRDLSKARRAVRAYIQTLEATVSELKQLVGATSSS